MARCGQIVDASLVQSPVQRKKHEEADTVKDGTMPLGWRPHKRAQKDVDVRWTKKHGKSYFGYKMHANVDKRYKPLRMIAVTRAPWPKPRYSSRCSIVPTSVATSMPIAATPPPNGRPR